jgi:hypothetical protein
MIPRIFVGGTGRSGTWILYRTLGSHSDIHTFPAELRFIVDPGGLVELVTGLTDDFSPTLARDALDRFEKLMREKLASFGSHPYAAIDLPKWLGGDYYWQKLDQFSAQLITFEHEARYWNQELKENDWTKRLGRLSRKLRQDPLKSRAGENLQLTREARYYSNRAELISLVSSFVEDLLFHAAENNKKKTWCEKTPQNLLHLDFIWELFPDCFFIHIKRDPRGVVYSIKNQSWGPNNIPDACRFMKGVYAKWFDLKSVLDFDYHRYFELKLEDFAATPSNTLERLAAEGGLEVRFENPPEIDPSKVSSWQNKISELDLNYLNAELGPIIEKMGYEL